MKVFRGDDVAFGPADARSFVGPAQARLLASANKGASVHVYHVQFDAGARTNWHTHSGPQWLLITEGQIRVQRWGEPAVDVGAGDLVVFAPHEKHWHGAAPGGRGVHIAMNIDATTEWLEPVSEADYLRSTM